MKRQSTARRAVAGFTLVETMVALVIGLLATFIVMQVFALSEGQKRTIMGGADAQSDGAVVLYLIERDLRQAGYGLSPNVEDFVPPNTPPHVLTNGILAQCTKVLAYKKNRAPLPDFTYLDSTFAPVVINPTGYPKGDANTDVVLVNYGSSGGMIGKGIPLSAQDGATVPSTGGDVPDYVLNVDASAGDPQGRAQFNQGDMILAVPPSGSGLDCTIGEITGLPNGIACTGGAVTGGGIPDPSNMVRVNHSDTTYQNFYTGCDPAKLTTATWNKAGAGVNYAAGSKLYNMGPRCQTPPPSPGVCVEQFVSRVYAVRKGNLTVCDLTVNDCSAAVADPPNPAIWTPVANGVVGLRAQYGLDTNLNGSIDNWVTHDWDTPTLAGAARAQVAAMRLAVVMRSGQYEKEEVTVAAPVWHKDASTATDITFDLTGSGSDWKHFRYKQAQSIVPVRNLIWGQQN